MTYVRDREAHIEYTGIIRRRSADVQSDGGRTMLAVDFFEDLCDQWGTHCPRCFQNKVYDLADGRRRCSSCGYTHRLFTGRWLSKVRLTPEGWHMALHCFEEGYSVRKASEYMEVNYDTGYKTYKVIRLAILNRLVSGDRSALFDNDNELIRFCPNLDREAEQTLCHGCRSYVFGLVMDRDGKMELDVVEGLKARELLAVPVPKRQWHSFIHTDRFSDRDAMIFSCCKRGKEVFRSNFTEQPVALDRINGFKSYAESLLTRYRTMQPEAYPLYLAETVFRYNHRHVECFDELAAYLCSFVPNCG